MQGIGVVHARLELSAQLRFPYIYIYTYMHIFILRRIGSSKA